MILSQECHVTRRQPCSTVASRSTSSSIASLSRPRKFLSAPNASRSLSSIMLDMHQPLRSYLWGCLSIAQWILIFQTLHRLLGCSSLCLLGDCALFDSVESLILNSWDYSKDADNQQQVNNTNQQKRSKNSLKIPVMYQKSFNKQSHQMVKSSLDCRSLFRICAYRVCACIQSFVC